MENKRVVLLPLNILNLQNKISSKDVTWTLSPEENGIAKWRGINISEGRSAEVQVLGRMKEDAIQTVFLTLQLKCYTRLLYTCKACHFYPGDLSPS